MSFFFGTPFPNFTVNNDRVLDNLRVRQPNTFKCPPATKDLINPNVIVEVIHHDDKPDEYIYGGSNNPATNATLRSGVAQAGALVYATEPILNKDAPNIATDGCFDGRNHLYFSDGDQWIPLANCLPRDADDRSLAYGEQYDQANHEVTTFTEEGVWVPLNVGAKSDGPAGNFTQSPDAYLMTYVGKSNITVKVNLSVSWEMSRGGNQDVQLGIVKNGTAGNFYIPEDNLHLRSALRQEDSNVNVVPRNASLSGFVELTNGDELSVRALIEGQGTSIDSGILFWSTNFNINKMFNTPLPIPHKQNTKYREYLFFSHCFFCALLQKKYHKLLKKWS